MSEADRASLLPLWPPAAPGPNTQPELEQESSTPPPHSVKIVRNVTQPRLAAFLPAPAMATGAAVIVCPGGAYHMLAIEHEGTDVARWLTARGVAAFVLRYRLIPTPPRDDEFHRQMQENLSNPQRMQELTQQIVPLAIADGQQALRLVRERVADWYLTPKHIGILGFSAGGVVAAGVAIQGDAKSQPNFAAVIYGAPWDGVVVPPAAPPLFIAAANDDPFAAQVCVPLYAAWTAAGRPVELHIYAQGGHGFGMRPQDLPADHWIDAFGAWLHGQGIPIRL